MFCQIIFFHNQFYFGQNEIEIDLNKTAFNCKLAAEKDHTKAMFNLLIEGKGVTVNKEEAARYIKIAADNGHSKAMHKYAIMLEKGESVKINTNESARYYKLAADEGEVEAMFRYACFKYGAFFSMEKRFEIDKKKRAASYFKIFADKNHIFSALHYAAMLDKGDGIVQDAIEVEKYYDKAADNGHVEAMYRL